MFNLIVNNLTVSGKWQNNTILLACISLQIENFFVWYINCSKLKIYHIVYASNRIHQTMYAKEFLSLHRSVPALRLLNQYSPVTRAGSSIAGKDATELT